MLKNIYRKCLRLLAGVLIAGLYACSTIQYKNIDNAGLNSKQQEAMIIEITNILKQNYPLISYKNIGLNADSEMSKALIKTLKLNGYIIDEPSKDNIKFKYYITKLDDSRIILSLYMNDIKASRIYILKTNTILAVSSITVGR